MENPSQISSSARSAHQALGVIERMEQSAQGVRLFTSEGELALSVYSSGIIRVRAARAGAQGPGHSYSVVGNIQETDWSWQEGEEEYVLKTAEVELKVQKNPLRLRFYNAEGTLVHADHATFGTGWIGSEATAYKEIFEGERFIGLGEKTGGLDRRGSAYVNYNTDNFAYPPDADPLYLSAPFYIGLHSQCCYGIFLDNTYKSVFNFGASNRRFSFFSVEDGALDYYFFSGETPAQLIENYSWLTGKMPLPPKWSLGYQQCRYSYYPDSEVLNIGRMFRDKGIPADVLYLDIHYMESYKVFTFDGQRFSDPAGLCKALEEMGFKVVLIVDPGIKEEKGYHAYEGGLAGNHFLQYPDGEPYAGEVWPGWSHFPDFTRPQTRDWWGSQFSVYTEAGIKGFWNDMNEPAAWGQCIPNLVEFDFEGEKTSHREARNVYGMQMARATYEGVRNLNPDERPFILTRAGFAGVQRYSAVWTGDNVTTDDSMMAGIRLVNSLGLTGIPFSGYDVGGFFGDATRELFARWIAVGAFSPFFRGHSMVNSRSCEPWSFGEEVEEIARNYVRLRYRLLPYLYSLFYEASQSGLPVARSLALDFPNDANIYDGKYNSQFLLGGSLMVIPTESKKEYKKLYLPEGEWFDMLTDEAFAGGEEHLVETPLYRIPVFVKGGGILPMQEPVAHTGENPGEVLSLHVYNGKEGSSFQMYDDDGSSYGYEKGEFYRRNIHLSPVEGRLELQAAEGSWPGMFCRLRIFFHGFGKVHSVHANEESLQIAVSDFAFMDPISDFDPWGPGEILQKIKELPQVECDLTKDTILITWKNDLPMTSDTR